MSTQRRYLIWMGGYLAVVAVVCALLYDPLKSAFMANWGFNALILCMLGAGIVINLYQVIRLEPELNWMHAYRTGTPGLSVVIPSLLSPLAKHLSGLHRNRFSLSALSMRTVLGKVLLANNGPSSIEINYNDRIAQLIFHRSDYTYSKDINFIEEAVQDTGRVGFGSSGMQ